MSETVKMDASVIQHVAELEQEVARYRTVLATIRDTALDVGNDIFDRLGRIVELTQD